MSPERPTSEPDPDGSELYQFAEEAPPLAPRQPDPEPEPPPSPPPLDVNEGEIDLDDEARLRAVGSPLAQRGGRRVTSVA